VIVAVDEDALAGLGARRLDRFDEPAQEPVAFMVPTRKVLLRADRDDAVGEPEADPDRMTLVARGDPAQRPRQPADGVRQALRPARELDRAPARDDDLAVGVEEPAQQVEPIEQAGVQILLGDEGLLARQPVQTVVLEDEARGGKSGRNAVAPRELDGETVHRHRLGSR